ncbi:tryptophan synthase subunit beta [Clostridium baratii]|uniref:tryptophan synthase subunit beta n=1 Tax=Clostridium baratii TaxID=1561 RepID=UPI0029043839|nr:tryptophan synthase subunit beta [Clostridium baratii]MDU1055064.1 tryptophan synthase subunit beta [Clostridium baratii]
MKNLFEERKGMFGEFGGQFVPDNIKSALEELEENYKKYINDEEFKKEYLYYLKEYSGRPTPLYYAENVSKDIGCKVYLKREDLNHTGAHKINNTIGQILLAKKMGKKKIIAETGAGQHGVATATVCAKFNMECTIFMGACDIERQALNVRKMKLLGANVISVESGTKTLNDAVNEAFEYLSKYSDECYYLIGSAVGPSPYPSIVRDFQKIIGEEAKKQIIDKEGRLPNTIIAAVGGGSNAIGIFNDFLNDKDVELIGIEGAGLGLNTKYNAATMALGEKGIVHGMLTYVLKDANGNTSEAYSISAGLDYPAIGPEHAYLSNIKRVNYYSITDKEAMRDGVLYLTKKEGIIPALESAHAVAYLKKLKGKVKDDDIIIVNLSGRGDKDMDNINKYLNDNPNL